MKTSGSQDPGAEPDETLCPRCDVILVSDPPFGARCPRCAGHHLDAAVAGPLLEREVGQSLDQLRELAGMFAGTRLPCPECSGEQSPVTLRGVPLDLCLGCGAVWLDAGELRAITEGRIEEVAAPKGDLTVQPRRRMPASAPGATATAAPVAGLQRFPRGPYARQWVIALVGVAVAAYPVVSERGFGLVRADAWMFYAGGAVLGLLTGLRGYLEVDVAERTVTQWFAFWRWRVRRGAARFEDVSSVSLEQGSHHSQSGGTTPSMAFKINVGRYRRDDLSSESLQGKRRAKRIADELELLVEAAPIRDRKELVGLNASEKS